MKNSAPTIPWPAAAAFPISATAPACGTTSTSLIGAASGAAFQWHFNPAMKAVKPIGS